MNIDKKKLFEKIEIDVDIGDTILVGKFKNKKEKVKNIGKDKHGMPTINGRKATTFRIHKRVNIFDEPFESYDIVETIKNLLKSFDKKKMDEFLSSVDIKDYLTEAGTSKSYPVDDGPATYYRSFSSYKKETKKWLDSLQAAVGWKLLNYILSDGAEDPEFDYTFTYNLVPAVSYGKSGVSGAAEHPIEKYKRELRDTVGTLGWKILNWPGLDGKKVMGVGVDSVISPGIGNRSNVDNTKKATSGKKFGRGRPKLHKENKLFSMEWWNSQLLLEDKSKIKKVIGIYGGRFQPFGPHHLKTYKWLEKQVDEAYITTSNLKKPPRHPMNFKEKVRHMTKMGIPSSKIIQEKTPYVADNTLKKFDSETTAVIYIFGKKDAGRLKGGDKKSGGKTYYQDYKKNKRNLEGYETHGYILTAPHVSITIPKPSGRGGVEVSGTAMRNLLGSPSIDDSERGKLFKKVFGYYDKGVFSMITNKFKKLFGEITEEVVLNEGVKDKLKKVFKNIKKEMRQNKKLGKVLTKYVRQGGKLSLSDTTFAKQQFIEALKLVGLTGLVLVPFGKFSIPVLVKVAEMVGMDLLPSSFKESVTLPINVGDTVLMGKFKNKKVVVKSIDFNEKGDLKINGKSAARFRLVKKSNIFDEGKLNESKKEFVIWGIAPGKSSEDILYTKAKSQSEAKKIIKILTSKHGVKKARIQVLDLEQDPSKFWKSDDMFEGKKRKSKKVKKKSTKSKLSKQKRKYYFKKEKAQKELEKSGKEGVVVQRKFGKQKAFFVSYKKGNVNVDLSEKLFSPDWWTRELLNEGGAYGHMAHPFDDKDLTFGDLKKIIEYGLGGTLNREDNVTEKLDGQNIMISWKDGKLIAARNKGHIKNGGKTALTTSGIASKFKGRGEIKNAFVFAMKDLEGAIKKLSDKQKEKIFNNGYNFMNMEVMWPASANVIDYDKAELVFHGALKYNDAGVVKGEVKGSGRILAGMIKQVNMHIGKKYKIGKPVFLDVPKHQDFGTKKDKFIGKLNKLKSTYGLKDNDTLALYHQSYWEEYIYNAAQQFGYKIPNNILKNLTKRWAFFDKSYKIPTIRTDLKEQPKFLEWVLKTDKDDHSKMVKENMKPFETLFFEVGAEVLKNVKGFMAANPTKAVQGIRKRLNTSISNVKASGDKKKLNTLKLQLDKLQSIGGVTAIVPSEGIVFKYQGKTYKFTGAFAPINQITGLISF